MKIAHFSDLHSDLSSLKDDPSKGQYDLYINTGDFFPNFGFWQTNPFLEGKLQAEWLTAVKDDLLDVFGKVPVLWVHGNHDFCSNSDILTILEGSNITILDNQSVEMLGFKFYGFRQIPYIGGRWNGEVKEEELEKFIKPAFDEEPDFLLTHSPAYGILDCVGVQWGSLGPEEEHVGSPTLRSYFDTYPHKIKGHFFGHIHEEGKQKKRFNGVTHSNASTGIQMIEFVSVSRNV